MKTYCTQCIWDIAQLPDGTWVLSWGGDPGREASDALCEDSDDGRHSPAETAATGEGKS